MDHFADWLIGTLNRGLAYADANNHGNAHGTLLRMVRDAEALFELPTEAFDEPPAPAASVAPAEPSKPAESTSVDKSKNSDLNVEKREGSSSHGS